MDLKRLNHIIKNGECNDTYIINNKTYYKILYQGTIFLISEYKNKIKLEGTI